MSSKKHIVNFFNDLNFRQHSRLEDVTFAEVKLSNGYCVWVETRLHNKGLFSVDIMKNGYPTFSDFEDSLCDYLGVIALTNLRESQVNLLLNKLNRMES